MLRTFVVSAMAAIGLLAATAAAAQSASELLEKGIYTEETVGNLDDAAVWGHSVVVTSRSVDRCVTTLRSKIEPDPHRPTYIHTIRDIGYRFECEVFRDKALRYRLPWMGR